MELVKGHICKNCKGRMFHYSKHMTQCLVCKALHTNAGDFIGMSFSDMIGTHENGKPITKIKSISKEVVL